METGTERKTRPHRNTQPNSQQSSFITRDMQISPFIDWPPSFTHYMDLPRGVYKTIILFLEKQGFTATSEMLRKDANISGDDFQRIFPESLVLKAVDSNEVQLVNDNTDLKRQFLMLEEEHKKLMAVATELTAALHNNMIGQTQHLNSMLESCKTIYPDLFVIETTNKNRTSAKENAQEIIESILSSATKSPRDIPEESQEVLPDCFVIEDKLVNKIPQSLAELDIELIKNNLLNAPKDVKISLMKCLSWMLSSDQATKESNVEICVKHDLLMFKNKVSLVEIYMSMDDSELQECMLRLVKSFAFVIGGREYLWEEGHRVICDQIVALVKQRKSLILIATLQKLSLIPSARLALLNTKLIHNLINSYHKLPIPQLTSYHWEYLMALLMNLSLQSDYSLPNNLLDKMFQLFENLLGALNIHCLPYIVSILFNLLDCPGIVNNLRNRKLLLLLENCVNNVNICESIRNQLELIVNTIKNVNEDSIVNLPKSTQLVGQESLDDCDKRLFCLDLINEMDVNVLNSFKKVSKEKIEKVRVKKRLSSSADLPFCYMELCTKLAGRCKCSKCNGGNRYTCRCYDILRNDLDLDNISTVKLKKQDKYQDLEIEQCSSCEKDEVCGCAAFESKPKIERTPP